jgi:small redox-active disulfide protein 2
MRSINEDRGLLRKGDDLMNIKILGIGCARCKDLEKQVRKTVEESGVEAVVEHVTDFKEIAGYGVLSTPAVVVDGEVKSVGKIPKKEEILAWLKSGVQHD